MKKLTPLFERELVVNSKNNSYLQFLDNVLTLEKLKYWTYQKTYYYLDWHYECEYLAYRFKIFKKWILLNQEYTKAFVKEFNVIASALDLKKEFTAQEQNYIEVFESVVFSKHRNIKNLIVDFHNLKNEEVWYRYDIIVLFSINKKNPDEIIKIADETHIFLTNMKIVFSDHDKNYLEIDFDMIQTIKLNNNFIDIYTDDFVYKFLSKEIKTIYTSIERVGKLIKKLI